MQRIKLGKSDLEVPVICLGGNVYGWTLPEADSLRQLDAALEAGLNFIDTADVYSRWLPGHKGGESETILGKWLAKGNKRSNVILATKLGLDMGDGKKGLSAAYIEQAVEDSLAPPADRLHRPVPGAPGRPGDTARRNTGCLRQAGAAGQSAAHRRFQLQRRTAGGSARRPAKTMGW